MPRDNSKADPPSPAPDLQNTSSAPENPSNGSTLQENINRQLSLPRITKTCATPSSQSIARSGRARLNQERCVLPTRATTSSSEPTTYCTSMLEPHLTLSHLRTFSIANYHYPTRPSQPSLQSIHRRTPPFPSSLLFLPTPSRYEARQHKATAIHRSTSMGYPQVGVPSSPPKIITPYQKRM